MSGQQGWGQAEPVRLLREAYGDEIELFDEQDESVAYRIMAEFRYNGSVYAVLQSDELRKEKEVAIFKISASGDGEPELETIEDDDEWETVSELYDEMSFPIQDRP
ncbi:DUF1292 domain-containing protein [Paenibacillus mesophilus]|uniref:DUF1292 domain-containing protein n=1 Tax=Paenibacillus mesophilus TaxID=2582849 RepID=UPI00110E7FEC|nr:DUF1292 domain-containing protein [Paenibacillus mesophilus]TMV52726.1 DUF1292 domain-containing protein [Paenibacillus mesophilus]